MTMIRRDYVDTPDYGQIHYRSAGDKQAPVLLLLHQVPSTSAMFDILMQQLAADFFCIAPDYPGFGCSDPLSGATTIGRYAEAVCRPWLHWG